MAFRDELFAKIGANDQEGETDPYKLIQAGDNETMSGNVAKATTLYKSAVTNGMAKAKKFEEQKQYRSAAEAYYLTSLGHLKLGNEEEVETLSAKVGEQLLEAANMYINTYEEYSYGVVCASLAGLIYVLLKDNEKAKSVYEDTLESIENKAKEGKIQIGKDKLVQTVWVIGYVLQAIQDVSHEALEEAQRLISAQIRPLLSKMKLAGISPLLDQTVSYVLEYFQEQIKLPNLAVSSQLPNDIVVNQIFEVKIDLMNIGEGIATAVRLELNLPEGLEHVDGNLQQDFEKLDPDQHEQITLHLRYQTSTPEDVKVKLGGKITFQDMLKNQQVQFVGPYDIDIFAESKKDKLGRQLKAEFEKAESIESLAIHPDYPPAFGTMLINFQKDLVNSVKNELDAENYEKIPGALEVLNDVRKELSTYFSKDGARVSELISSLQEMKEEYAQSKIEEAMEIKEKELEERIESLKIKLKDEKNQALEQQKDEFTKASEEISDQHKAELTQLRASLTESFEKDKKELISSHKIELEEYKKKIKDEIDQNTSLMDRKLNAKLSEQENTLREEFNKQISEINEKNATTVAELRKQFEDDKNSYVEELKKQLTADFEEEKNSLISEYEEKLRMQKDQIDQEYELKRSQIESKYKQEIQMIKDDYEMKLKENS